MFQHLDTAIAFLALMLCASLLVMAGTQLLVSLLGLRSANLRRSLAELFQTASDDRDAKRYAGVIARRVLHQPLVSGSIFSGSAMRFDDLPFIPPDAAGKLRWAGSGIPLQPWLLGAVAGTFLWPAALFLVTRVFSEDFCAYLSAASSYVPFLNLCDHPWRSGAVIGAVLGGLMSRWRLATSIRLDELVGLLEKLSAPAGGTLPDPAQRAMLVLAGEARSKARPKINTASAQMERMFRDASDEGEGGVAIAVEKAVTVAQVSGHAETRVEGLNLWFDHAMDRASQRFTMQARVITVVLSCVLVFAAHFDALRLFQSLSSDAQMRAQLAASADALTKQADQLPKTKEVSRTLIPDVYRSAMASVLALAPPVTEQPKAKPRRSSHAGGAISSFPSSSSSDAITPSDAQGAGVSSANGEAGQGAASDAPAAVEAPKKERKHKAAQASSKPSEKERAQAASVPGEDKTTVAAKVKALKALETTPGFASREDALLWLRVTLDGNPALEHLASAYEQELNGELGTDSDKLLDHSASVKRELARSTLQLLPESWPGPIPNEREFPGLLLSVALLCVGAPVCYNLLKRIASLRPLQNIK